MAAWVFPLAVKLLLRREGYYTLSEHDEGHCFAIDKLLAETNWRDEVGDSRNDSNKWQNIVSSAKEDRVWKKRSKELEERWRQLFPEADME